MRQRNETKYWGKSGIQLLFGLLWVVSSIGHVVAQTPKGIVFTDADLGKEVKSNFRFSDAADTWNLTLKHRLGAIGPLEISSPKAGQFDGAFQLSQALPLTLMPGEAKDIKITVNYGKSIKENTELILVARSPGETDPLKTVLVKLNVSADGKAMFWDEKNKRYASTIPTLVFDGAGDKVIEIVWNGSGAGSACTAAISGDARGAFKLIPNASGSTPLANGSTVNVSKNSMPIFVRYSGPGAKGSAADIGRLEFKDANGRSLNGELYGTKKGGGAAIAAKDPNSTGVGKVGPFTMDVGKDPLKGQPVADAKDAIKHNTGIPGLPPSANVSAIRPTDGTTPKATVNPSAKDKPISVIPEGGFTGSITDPIIAQAHLESFFARRQGENIISVGEVTFRKTEEFFEARFKIALDSLDKDKSMTIKPIWVSAISGEDSLPVPMTNVQFDRDSMLLRVKLPSETVSTVSSQDSFLLRVGFMPEYLAGSTPVYLANQKSMFTGSTIGRIFSESYFWLWIWLLVVLVVAAFFVLGFLWIRRPLTTFRYLRESRYQRDRYVGRDEEFHIEIETVHLDLSRHDTDLIQLAYNLHSNSAVTGVADQGTGKVRMLDATVTAPARRGLYKFYLWFYGLFGRSKDPRFRSVYYSLRIEPVHGGIPQNLRLKDESGVLLLGTSLTGNVLATDHQDFRFTMRPFQYKIYLDPSEILDYSGTMKTVTIPFRVIEEPFEGYVMTREFRLNLEIQNKA